MLKTLIGCALLLCAIASAQQNTITGYNQIVGQWDASQAAGSPNGRDVATRVGECYFQTDAAAGSNNWNATALPSTWSLVSGTATGTVTSVATACGIGGGPVTTSGTVKGSVLTDPQNGAGAFAIPAADCGKVITRNQASAVSDTIAQAGGSFPAGWYVGYQCMGAGGCTVTPTTSTINGGASLVLTQGQGVTITSDGTNYQILGSIAGGGGTFAANSIIGNPTGSAGAAVAITQNTACTTGFTGVSPAICASVALTGHHGTWADGDAMWRGDLSGWIIFLIYLSGGHNGKHSGHGRRCAGMDRRSCGANSRFQP